LLRPVDSHEELTKFNAERKGDATSASGEEKAKAAEEQRKLSHREELAKKIKADMIASERRRLADATAGKVNTITYLPANRG
jgi:hypothetical protein